MCEKHSFLRKLEHTPDPELAVYEGSPFIVLFGGTWGMFQGSDGDACSRILVESVGSLKFISWRSMCQ